MGRRADALSFARLQELRKFMLAAVAPDVIQALGKRELHELQIRFGLARVWGVPTFQARFMADGVSKSDGQRTIDIVKLTKVDPSNRAAVELVKTTVTRYILLLLITPINTRTTGAKYLAASTIAASARHLCCVISRLVHLTPVSKDKIFDRCDIDALENIRRSKKQSALLGRLLELQQRGYWLDVPAREVLEADVHTTGGTPPQAEEKLGAEFTEVSAQSSSVLEDDANPSSDSPPPTDEYIGADVAEATAQPLPNNDSTQQKPFFPLPDPFVAELGWRCSWYIKVFESSLLKCAREVAKKLSAVQPGKSKELHAFESKQSRVVEKFLETYEWKYSDGTPIKALKFQIFSAGQGNRTAFQWPPRNLSHIQQLLSIAQSMHLVVALLSFAGRISEVLSFKREDFIEEGLQGRTAKGRTYKWSQRVNGSERDWPLPEVAEISLNRQRELVQVRSHLRLGGRADDSDAKGLWEGPTSGEDVTAGYNGFLEQLADALGLTPLLLNKKIHAHRFRVTIARLMALAVVGAPKILMDLFGHDSIETTLHYILKDPLIRQEMEEVAKAQTIMLAETTLKDAENCGGPAAEKIRTIVEKERARLGKEFGAETFSELAEICTLSGTQWMLVRPGVICTKLPHQTGPCNIRQSQPDTSKCRSKCDHRLEMSILRNEVDSCIGMAVSEVERCLKEDDPIGAEHWKGQVTMNIDRFPDIRQKWASHPVVLAS